MSAVGKERTGTPSPQQIAPAPFHSTPETSFAPVHATLIPTLGTIKVEPRDGPAAEPRDGPAAAWAPGAAVAPMSEEDLATYNCLRHGKGQAKKKCTCGKARSYTMTSRGFKIQSPADARREFVEDGVAPVVDAMRRHAGDALVQSVCCLALGNACTSRDSARAIIAAGGLELARAAAARFRGADAQLVARADRAVARLTADEFSEVPNEAGELATMEV